MAESYFRGKYVVVKREGLAFGVCGNQMDSRPDNPRHALHVEVLGGSAHYKMEEEMSHTEIQPPMLPDVVSLPPDKECGEIVPVQLSLGEVLAVRAVWASRGSLTLFLIVEKPHAVVRTYRNSQYQTQDRGGALVEFGSRYNNPVDAAGLWLDVFGSLAEAEKFAGRGKR